MQNRAFAREDWRRRLVEEYDMDSTGLAMRRGHEFNSVLAVQVGFDPGLNVMMIVLDQQIICTSLTERSVLKG